MVVGRRIVEWHGVTVIQDAERFTVTCRERTSELCVMHSFTIVGVGPNRSSPTKSATDAAFLRFSYVASHPSSSVVLSPYVAGYGVRMM